MNAKFRKIAAALTATLAAGAVASLTGAHASTIVLYDQDFENPNGFIDTSGIDVSQQTVNQLYSNQPPGFVFSQTNTVETLLIGGSNAFGTGYTDPSGDAGNYIIGMLSNVQDDRLGLAFDVMGNDFFNVGIDLTAIDLSGLGGPFTNASTPAPLFQFTLYDNPGGAPGIGGGTILDQTTVLATLSPQTVVEFTSAVLALDATAATNGNVILQIDLLQGGYAGFDNLRITASDTPGDLGEIPIPGAAPLFATALAGAAYWRRRRRKA